MAKLLSWLLRRLRPREGWAALLLTLVTVLCIPASLVEANHDVDAPWMIILSVLALIVGLRLARSRLASRSVLIVALVLGITLTIVVVGRLLPPLSLLWSEIGYAARWLGRHREAAAAPPLPLSTTGTYLWQQLQRLGIRLWWWSQGVAGGGPARDPIASLLLGTFLSWTLTLFATWQIYRSRKPFIGLAPGGVLVAILAFFSAGLTTFYLLTYLFCTLWLVAICYLWQRRDHWDQSDTDYPDNLGFELSLALSPWLTGLLLLAAVFPVIYPNRVRESFWQLMDGPWSRVEQISERLFGPIESTYPGIGGTAADPAGTLPSSHLLGGRTDLDETIILYVTTNDPPPPTADPTDPEPPQPQGPRRYWRSTTYATYTGQGWTNEPLEPHPAYPGQTLSSDLPAGSDLIQQFTLLDTSDDRVYLVNMPLQVDHQVQAWWRDPADLAFVTGSRLRYTAISRPPELTIADLRAAPEVLPPDLAKRYLALPDTVPQRVLDLATQVVAETKGRYDQARAIETFLRTYTYTLDLPLPPPDHDLVDYFLFDVQEGYCDYYASAMIIMARAVGIPARLASGYAQGTYDHSGDRWVVSQKDSHSWVEVYFETIGWVEFEPTAGLPALVRPGSDLPQIVVPPKPPRALGSSEVPLALVAIGVVFLMLLAALIWTWRAGQRQNLAPVELVRDRHTRLVRWGTRLGYPLHEGLTSLEYSEGLKETLRRRGQASRWSRARRAGTEAPTQVETLTDLFNRAQYAPVPISHRESWRIRDLWFRLRRHLWWLWLARH